MNRQLIREANVRGLRMFFPQILNDLLRLFFGMNAKGFSNVLTSADLV
jgi:hypothetical protein